MKRSWSPLLKVLLATLGLVAAAAGGGSGLSAQNQKQSAQKPSYVTTQYPVQVQFRDLVGTVDTPGDAVTSDGRIYKDGAEGVSAYMQVTTQSGVVTDSKFVLSIGAVKGKVVRSINLNYTNRVATSCDSNTENNPSGTAHPTTVQVLSHIPVMKIGQTIAGGGGFWASTATDVGGVFRFRDPRLGIPPNNYPDNCSNLFVITRDSAIDWTVTTDTIDGTPYYDLSGNPVSDPPGVGSTASFENASGTPPYGNYSLRFKMHITCLSACPAERK
jgi:hypothetical protein